MILTKIISTAKAELLVIGGLPEETMSVKVSGTGYLCYKVEKILSWNVVEDIDIAKSNWQPVGFLDKISEDEAKELLPESEYSHLPEDSRWYYALLFDLIESEIKLKNKYGELNYDHLSGIYRSEKGQADDYEWQAEQSDVFTNPFILIKK